MKLLIDNSEESEIIICAKNQKWEKFVISNKAQKPLLLILENFLFKNKKNFKDITGIAVVVGKGRFTATRIAVTIVNTLGYALKIPVVSVISSDTELAEKAFKKAKPGVFISAKYSGEAHIGGQK